MIVYISEVGWLKGESGKSRKGIGKVVYENPFVSLLVHARYRIVVHTAVPDGPWKHCKRSLPMACVTV
jgi:hypothetical protein